MKRILIYTGAGLLLLLLLLAGGLWLFRNRILNRIAERKIAQVEERYGLEVNYDELRFEGTGRLFLNGLSVVPEERDTLLTLQSATFNLGFWQLLKGNVEVMDVALDGLTVDLSKKISRLIMISCSEADRRVKKKRNGPPKRRDMTSVCKPC